MPAGSSTDDVVIKHIGPQTVASVRDVLPAYHDVARLFGAIFSQLGPRGVRPAGPVMAIYHDGEYREHGVDVEAAVPLNGPLSIEQPVIVREMSDVPSMACLVHQGSYEALGQAYAALMSWIEANGYRMCGPNREIYLHGPESGDDPASYITELQCPVEKA